MGELLDKTQMVDFTKEIAQKIPGLNEERFSDAKLTEKRGAVVDKLKCLKEECGPLHTLVNDQEKVKQLRADKQFTMPFLAENFKVTQQNVLSLYDLGKFWFEAGDYNKAADSLFHCRTLFTSLNNLDRDKSVSAVWGKFASEILIQQWDSALDDMSRLKEIIDSRSFTTPLQQLQQHVADSLELVCLLQSPQRSEWHHRHVLPGALPEHHPDELPTHPQVSHHGRSHEQAETHCPEGPGEGDSAGVVHVQGSDHGVPRNAVCAFRFRGRAEEAPRVRDGAQK